MYNSLAQVVLRSLSPGVPDVYQATELWSFTLVDPDNRGPVDFARCARLLRRIDRQAADHGRTALARGLMDRWTDGAIKLYVTSQTLRYRRAHTELFDGGHYIPLQADGAKEGQVCSFGWQGKNNRLIVVTPRLVARLTRSGAILPLGTQAWGDTSVVLPKRFAGSYRNILTEETVACSGTAGRPILRLAECMQILPVAVLEST